MAEGHVRKATNGLLAASGPGDLIDEQMLTEFASAAYVTWGEATGLITSLFGDLPTPMFESIIDAAVRESTTYYHQLLTDLIGKKAFKTLRDPIYGEFFKGNIVQPGDIRPLLVQLGGGSTDVTVPLMGGITSGNTMREWLRSNGIDTDLKIWLYGLNEVRRTFNGHLQMDGLVFDKWDDPALRIAPQDAWLRREFYAPGDHFGCACVVAPYIPNYDQPFQLETPVV